MIDYNARVFADQRKLFNLILGKNLRIWIWSQLFRLYFSDSAENKDKSSGVWQVPQQSVAAGKTTLYN